MNYKSIKQTEKIPSANIPMPIECLHIKTYTQAGVYSIIKLWASAVARPGACNDNGNNNKVQLVIPHGRPSAVSRVLAQCTQLDRESRKRECLAKLTSLNLEDNSCSPPTVAVPYSVGFFPPGGTIINSKSC
jgi:hypothetical protein